MSAPAVTEVVVRGIKNEHGEEVALSAEVYMENPVSMEELRANIDKQLAELPPYKQIKDIILRDEPFPKTSSKKIKR